MNVYRENPFCFKSISHLKSLTLLCVFEMTLNLIYTIEVTMFIPLILSRICYFKVGEKSERLTVIFIIIRGVITRINFTILLGDFPQNKIG